ncbi:hypothetical protein FIBSPDRAFT_243985 [Athelia psychrophila]|uniref:Secreted protein n=1 Tax=Athelia psychrophila TaxID=1759441 RepID=A0A165Y245_9AGAM|nr:hypothetical protein FIBSPDRAFT_243985 [Fibularhizoctonia sp. CBS 109695]
MDRAESWSWVIIFCGCGCNLIILEEAQASDIPCYKLLASWQLPTNMGSRRVHARQTSVTNQNANIKLPAVASG